MKNTKISQNIKKLQEEIISISTNNNIQSQRVKNLTEAKTIEDLIKNIEPVKKFCNDILSSSKYTKRQEIITAITQVLAIIARMTTILEREKFKFTLFDQIDELQILNSDLTHIMIDYSLDYGLEDLREFYYEDFKDFETTIRKTDYFVFDKTAADLSLDYLKSVIEHFIENKPLTRFIHPCPSYCFPLPEPTDGNVTLEFTFDLCNKPQNWLGNCFKKISFEEFWTYLNKFLENKNSPMGYPINVFSKLITLLNKNMPSNKIAMSM